MDGITTCLWFDHQAEEAARFYVSVFKGRLGKIMRYTEESARESGQPVGSVLTIDFEARGHQFIALNGGPLFQFSQATSFIVTCDTQQEVDRFWKELSAGGEEQPCGWLKDRYGVSWQIVPSALQKMLTDPDAKKAKHAMEAMLQMKKIDLKKLEAAYGKK